MSDATYTFGWSGRTVTLGVLDDVAVEAFSDGDCSTFALALNMLLDGEIMAVVEAPGTEMEQTSHYVVRVGDGSFVDVEGTTDENTMVSRWSARLRDAPVGIRSCKPPYMRDVYERQDVVAATTIAAVVAAQHRCLVGV